MAGIIITIVLSLCLGIPVWWTGVPLGNPMPFEAVMIATSILMLSVALVGPIRIAKGVSRAQFKEMPHALKLFRRDKRSRLGIWWTCIFIVLSFFGAILLQNFPSGLSWILPLWIILFGVTFDVLRAALRRLIRYTSCPFLLKRATHYFRKALKKCHEDAAIDWVKSVTEALEKATKRSRLHCAECSLTTIETMVEGYVNDASQRAAKNPSSEQPSLLDRVNHLSMLVCKRLKWTYMTAMREHVDPIAFDIISSFGKISLVLSRQHPLLANIPLACIIKCMKAVEPHQCPQCVDTWGMSIHATRTLSEACKAFIRISTEKNASYKELIRNTLIDLGDLVKSAYEKRYVTNPALLMQSFTEIGDLLEASAYKNCPDREIILGELRRLMAESGLPSS